MKIIFLNYLKQITHFSKVRLITNIFLLEDTYEEKFIIKGRFWNT